MNWISVIDIDTENPVFINLEQVHMFRDTGGGIVELHMRNDSVLARLDAQSLALALDIKTWS
jgi:hypothetical protein